MTISSSSSKRRYDPPRHQWTEKQTHHLLETITSSQTYLDTFFPPSAFKSALTKYELEKELCLFILDGTEWMRWMISNGKIRREGVEGRLEVLDGWEKSGNPVRSRLDLIHKDAREARRLLGEATSPEELRSNSAQRLMWNDYQNSGKYTWYFLYVQAQMVHNPDWVNNPSPTLQSSRAGSGSSSAPESTSATPLRNLSTNHPVHRSILVDGRASDLSTTSKTYTQSDRSTLPRSTLPAQPVSTPTRPPTPPRPATTSKRRSYPSQPIPASSSSASSSRPAPSALDGRSPKRPRKSLPSSQPSSDIRPLLQRVGKKAPDVISISSDSDEHTDSDDEDEDEDGSQNSRSQYSLRNLDGIDILDIQVSTTIRKDPSTSIPFIPIPSNTLARTPARITLTQKENLEAIRNMSGPIMTPRNRNRNNSDSEDELESESDGTSSRPPTPPLPDFLAQDIVSLQQGESSNTSSRAISPHFMEGMFHDPSIRSYRLEALHRNLGKSPPPPASAITSSSKHQNNDDENGGSDEGVLRLHAIDHDEEEDPRKNHLVYSPLIITDGTLPDFPIALEVDDPPTIPIGGWEMPIEISDDEDWDVVVIGQENEVVQNQGIVLGVERGKASIDVSGRDGEIREDHGASNVEVEHVIAIQPEDKHEDMEMEVDLDSNPDADLDDLNSESEEGDEDELEDMDLCSDLDENDHRDSVTLQGATKDGGDSDESWEMVDRSILDSFQMDKGVPSPHITSQAETLSSHSKPSGKISQATSSMLSDESTSLSTSTSGIPPSNSSRSAIISNRSQDSLNPMIRILLLELKHTSSRALADIEVVLQTGPLSSKGLKEIIELMGGSIVRVGDQRKDGKIRYTVVGRVDSELSDGEEGRGVTVMDLMGIIADLRERELS